MIKLPDNYSTYIRQIRLRCNNLIQFGIWEGIELENLNLWWKNFKNDEEQYFAATILDALMYRSDKQVGGMFFELFSRKIPSLIYKSRNLQINNLPEKLLNTYSDPKIRVSAPLFEEDPTKSGHVIMRELKRRWVDKKWLITPSEILARQNNGVEVLIILDDFSGTGQQIHHFIQKSKIQKLLLDDNFIIVFACLCMHQKSRDFLRSEYPNLLVTSAELIKEDYSCFDIHKDGINTRENYKNFYLTMLKQMGIKKIDKNNTYGRGNIEIVYAFQQSVPNNSLNILYFNYNGWNPLFPR